MVHPASWQIFFEVSRHLASEIDYKHYQMITCQVPSSITEQSIFLSILENPGLVGLNCPECSPGSARTTFRAVYGRLSSILAWRYGWLVVCSFVWFGRWSVGCLVSWLVC